MTNLLHAVRLAGLTARLTRLATADTITEPARDALTRRVQFTATQRAALAAGDDIPPPASWRAARARLWASELLTCQWCMGVWVAAAVTAADQVWGHTRWWRAVGTAATAAYATGWLAEHEGD